MNKSSVLFWQILYQNFFFFYYTNKSQINLPLLHLPLDLSSALLKMYKLTVYKIGFIKLLQNTSKTKWVRMISYINCDVDTLVSILGRSDCNNWQKPECKPTWSAELLQTSGTNSSVPHWFIISSPNKANKMFLFASWVQKAATMSSARDSLINSDVESNLKGQRKHNREEKGPIAETKG